MLKWTFLLLGTVWNAGSQFVRMFPHRSLRRFDRGEVPPGPNARILLMTGFCGAFTTFSTFMLETTYLIKDGEFARAFLNVGISLVAGFILFLIGNFLAKGI